MQNTYKYEVTFKKNKVQTYEEIRACSKGDAAKKIFERYGDIQIISISRVGN